MSKSEKLTEVQLRYLFKSMMSEILDEHYYDAMRELYWYTGWQISGFGDVKRINRENGMFFIYHDRPYIEVSEEEFRDLVGLQEENDDEW